MVLYRLRSITLDKAVACAKRHQGYRSTTFGIIGLVCLCLFFPIMATAADSSTLEVLRVTPSGQVTTSVRQIVIEFNKIMVPIGRMDRQASEVPVVMSPSINCSWRWLNQSTLACNISESEPLKAATVYEVRVTVPLKAYDGSNLPAEVKQTFTTSGPEVSEYWFNRWKGPETPEFFVTFNQGVRQHSVARHLYFLSSDGYRTGVVLKRKHDSKDRSYRVLPEEALPVDSEVQLVIEPGVLSLEGEEPGREARSLTTFYTFPKTSLIGVSCRDLANKELLIQTGDELGQNKECDPLSYIALQFSAPVTANALKKAIKVTPPLGGDKPDTDPWASVYNESNLAYGRESRRNYDIGLPWGLKADSTYRVDIDFANLHDEFGREVSEGKGLTFRTSHRAPKYHLEHEISVMEKDTDSSLPLVVTNLKSINLDFDYLTAQGLQRGQKKTWVPYQVSDLAYAYPLTIRDLLKGNSGVVSGKLKVDGVVDNPKPQMSGSSWLFSEVTPFHVHVKVGHFNSLVWVTRFSDGQPVADANVRFEINSLKKLQDEPKVKGASVSDADGLAILPGTSEFDPDLKLSQQWNKEKPQVFVRVEKDGDIALVPLVYDLQAYSDEVYPSSQQRYGHVISWGTTAQGLYRAGDTVQFKVYVRNQDNRTLTRPPQTGWNLKVVDPMDKVVFESKNIALSEFGSLNGEFATQKTGAVGWYRFELGASFTNETWEPLKVLISDFTPSPFGVTTTLDGEIFETGQSVNVNTRASLHAGGPYVDAPVRITATLSTAVFSPKSPVLKGYEFDSYQDSAENISEEQVYQGDGKLDGKGTYDASFKFPKAKVFYGSLMVESAVKDDRGKNIAGYAYSKYVGRDRFVGINQPDWILEKGKEAIINAAVADKNGVPVSGTLVKIVVEQEQVKAARIKSAGNAYLTNYESEWVTVNSCEVMPQSVAVGLTQGAEIRSGQCKFMPPSPGYYRITATINDSKSRSHQTRIFRWASGLGDVVWNTGGEYALKIVPSQSEYKVGDLARFMVQNPYPGARALVTVERYGVQQKFVKLFNSNVEFIDLPITEDHLPGVYLSVLIMSPRVEKPLEGKVDLGKPAFKMGYVHVPIIDHSKELLINVKSQQAVYKPGSLVTVDASVAVRNGKLPPTEMAVTVLDESVYQMLRSGRDYFDPYKGFYSNESLDVRNYNLMRILIGRQKFEKKGANPGGDGGGNLDMRSIFKFVSYWNPSIKLDASGKTSFSFVAPDNLTGWKILALAISDTDRMGLGEGEFKVNRATELRPILPNQVVEGDDIAAGFTVMNRTDKPRKLKVSITASGALDAPASLEKIVEAEPYKRVTLRLPIKAKGTGQVKFVAKAEDEVDRDGMEAYLEVRKRASLETIAFYGMSEDSVEEKLLAPVDMRADVGRFGVVLTPSLIGKLDGVFEYMRDYPYGCWEQKLTKALMAAYFLKFKPYVSKNFKWDGAAELISETMKAAASYQAADGGMSFYVPSIDYVCPYLSAFTAYAMNRLVKMGYSVPEQVASKLDAYLVELLKRDVFPDYYSRGMKASVRALAILALSERGKVDAAEVMRFQQEFEWMNLFGKAQYLQALQHTEAPSETIDNSLKALLNFGNEQAGLLAFSEQVDLGYERILETPMRANCAILEALIAAANSPAIEGTDKASRLMRYIGQSMKSGQRWYNTQENMFCLSAMADYAAKYEKESPNMKVEVLIDSDNLGKAEIKNLYVEPIEFDKPVGLGDPGKEHLYQLNKKGEGNFYYTGRLQFAPQSMKSDAINAGMEIKREYEVERNGDWRAISHPVEIKSGDLVRVNLFVSLPAARNYVVVEDAVPGGLEPVNRDLATASETDAGKDQAKLSKGSFCYQRDDWMNYAFSRWSFYHQELKHDAVRFYSDHLEAGNYYLSYVAQAISPGHFVIMPAHVEEMYSPDVFGKSEPDSLVVEE